MRWLRDPLVVFLGVGTLIFLAASHFSDEKISYVVELDEEEVERISDRNRFGLNGLSGAGPNHIS